MLLSFTGSQRLLRLSEGMARRHLHSQVSDPQLRTRLTPHFRLGCKRVLLSNDYYPALSQPNVEVVTDPIAQADRGGLVTRGPDGTTDASPLRRDHLRHGLSPSPMCRWRRCSPAGTAEHCARCGTPAACRHCTAPRSPASPNLFLLVGPNTGLGHSSIIFMIESQLAYVIGALAELARSGQALEPASRRAAAHSTPAFSASSPGRCGRPGAARAGIRTPMGATPRCGRPSRSAFAVSCAASTLASTRSASAVTLRKTESRPDEPRGRRRIVVRKDPRQETACPSTHRSRACST